jgi:hypothetical protein
LAVPGAAPGRRPSTAFSAQLELLPVGIFHAEGSGPSDPVEADIATAYGLSGSLEYIVAPDAALGVNPGVVLGLKPDGATTSATEIDLRARLRLGRLSNDGFGAHAYVSAGASWISFPGNAPTSFGAIIGVGIAVSHPVEHAAFITVEVGYQLGFQSATVRDEDVEASSRLFHIALGIGRYL